MGNRKYKVVIDQAAVVAREMNIEVAILLVKALFERDSNPCMTVTVQEEEYCCACESAGTV